LPPESPERRNIDPIPTPARKTTPAAEIATICPVVRDFLGMELVGINNGSATPPAIRESELRGSDDPQPTQNIELAKLLLPQFLQIN
jgi:hypothetical protein